MRAIETSRAVSGSRDGDADPLTGHKTTHYPFTYNWME